MAINVLISVQYNDWFLYDMVSTVDPMLLPSGNPIKCHEKVLSLQPIMFPPERFDIFPPCLGDAQKFRCVQTYTILPYYRRT